MSAVCVIQSATSLNISHTILSMSCLECVLPKFYFDLGSEEIKVQFKL